MPDGGYPSAGGAPAESWNANTGPHQQWSTPASGPPASASPASGPPASPAAPPQTYRDQSAAGADGWSAAPASASPQSGAAWSPEPQSSSGWGAPALPGDSVPQYQPRIPPTPPKQRRPILPLIVGIVVALPAGGAGGYFLGAAGTDNPAPKPTPSTATLGLFDSVQAASNKAKLDGELSGLAEPWLTSTLGDCAIGGTNGAPPLNPDESRHVTCRYASIWVHFVVFKSDAQRTQARTFRLQLNLNSDEIAPGVHDPSRTTGGVSGAPGKVIEYAYRMADGRALCGLAWERDGDQLATETIEAKCEEDLHGKWEPLRDLWQRHS
jgi:hypothetical protein